MLKFIRLLAWLFTAAITLGFITQPVSVGAQLALASTAIVGMITLWRFGRGLYVRWLFLTLGSLVVMRYIFWRATSTLPPLDQPMNFTLGLLLVVAELYCVIILVISLIINADPLDRKPLERGDDADLPTVDVFIPTYNEDHFILATTLAAAKSMDYPAEKLTIWLLDDGGTDQKCDDPNVEKATAAKARRLSLQMLCADLGARYLTRARNEHAKAGNLNAGLAVSSGELVTVFDADHAPFRSFLRETVGFFHTDPRLFLVQTPHVFLNPDPIERNLRTFQSMPSENEMFYSITQRGLDKWDSSFFCGSAALLRREALDVAGGFSGVTITEDCETAFELHAKGWHSVYVDKPLIAGLQPETFDSFIGQRSRWCQGMFQILILKNPLFKSGLKPIQKLAYLSSMTFWFFPLPRMIFTFAPLLHIFLDVKIFVSSMDEALAYTATYMVVNLMLQNYLYGRVRWPFVSELYEYVQGVYLAKAIVSVVMKPRKPTFNVTAKGISLDNDHLSSLAWPFFAIFALLLAGAGTAFYRYFTEPGAELMLIVGLWTSFNLVIAGVALGVIAERREVDRFPRLAIDRRGKLTIGEADVLVAIDSVSAGGCSIRFASEEALPTGLDGDARCSLAVFSLDSRTTHDPLVLDLVHATRGEDKTMIGFAFTDMTPASYMALADLMYGDPDAMSRFQQGRRAHKNLMSGCWQFLRWGLLEPMRAFAYLTHRKVVEVVAPIVEAQPISTALIEEPLSIPMAASTAPAMNDMVPAVRETTESALDDAMTVVEDFDALAASFSETATQDAIVDVTADWMHALLTLAATEMKRETAQEESVLASSSVAA